MGLQVIGAGLPRTGTSSLKAALELLLAGRCYHMSELNDRFDEDGPRWLSAFGEIDPARRDRTLMTLLDGWAAAVDWPASLFWRELAQLYPDALVILSRRRHVDDWWTSIDATVWENIRRLAPSSAYASITKKMLDKAGLGADWNNPDAVKRLYDQVIVDVTATVHPKRLLIWEPGDGWEPLCAALEVPIPHTTFFRANTRDEFRRQSGLDD